MPSLSAISTEAQLPLCGCGCGSRVTSLTSRYLKGHYDRSKRLGRPKTLAPVRCRGCKAQFSPSNARRRFCSSRCAADAKLKDARPQGPLAEFLDRQWWESGLGHAAYAQSIGLADETFRRLRRGQSKVGPDERILSTLRAAFGDSLPDTASVTDYQRERMRTLRATHEPWGHSEQSKAKVSEAMRAIRQREREDGAISRVERLVAAQTESGNLARNAERFTQWAVSNRGRLVSALSGRIHQRSPTPNWATVKAWADEVGTKYDVPPRAVLDVWRPYLEARGIWPSVGGRPAMEERCRLVRELDAIWPRSVSGARSTGFWKEATNMVREVEKSKAPDHFGLKAWWMEHRKICAAANG